MAQELTFASAEIFSREHSGLIESLYAEANGARWGLSRTAFAEGLRRSAEKRFRGAPYDPPVVEGYLKLLHLEDFALACACAEGREPAWEFFVEHFREDLRGASRAILRASGSGDATRAEELADSLYAELYGIRTAAGAKRKSLFEYFHGHSKLATWLRAILAQRHVDLLRADRGTISLDFPADGNEGGAAPIEMLQSHTSPADPDRAKYLSRLDRALAIALAGLTPRDRMLLAYYYVDQLKLAQIGRIFREHESTISRQLERIRRTLRESVTQNLRDGAAALDGQPAGNGFDELQVAQTFEYALEDWPFDLSRALAKADTQALADPPDP